MLWVVVFFQAEDGIRDDLVTGVQTCALPILQGMVTATAIGGVASFTNLSYTVAETMNLIFSNAALTAVTSSNVVVSAAAANKLTILTQPSPTATAGVAFTQQPQIRIEDQFGNFRGSDNSTIVTAARNAGSGTLQGTTNATAVGGIVSFANLAHNVATNITLQFSSAGLAFANSGTIAVSPASASRLTIAIQPSATATAGVAFAQQPVIRIEDAFGNLVNSDNSTVLTAARNAGSGTLQGMLNATAANGVAAFTNLSHFVATNITISFSAGALAGTTSSNIAISAALADHLAVQTQPSPSAIAGVAFAPQPVVRIEDQFGNLCTGTNATVTAARNAGSGTLQGTLVMPLQNGLATFTNLSHTVATTITISFSGGGVTPVTSGNVIISPAAAGRLTIQTQPSATATAGGAFAQQPVGRGEDSFGNLRTSATTTVVTLARAAGSGVLQGTSAATAAGGLATFTNLSHNVATNITIVFTSGSLTGATSSNIVVSAAT